MAEVQTKSVVITQGDIDANPILAELGAQVGDTLTDTPVAAPTPQVGDTCTMPDGVTPGTMQDDGSGTGTLVCTPAELPPAPAVGGTCQLPSGAAGVYANDADENLVCVPTGDQTVGEEASLNGIAGTMQLVFVANDTTEVAANKDAGAAPAGHSPAKGGDTRDA